MSWEPGNDYCIRLTDKSCKQRTVEDFKNMFARINEIVNEFDFSIVQGGSFGDFRNSAVQEFLFITNRRKNEA